MSEKNRVEVIMPVYNPSSWVFEAIDSVLNQTYDNCFLTVIDDSSIERKYIKKLKKYLKNEEKASFYLLKENIGAAGARNGSS